MTQHGLNMKDVRTLSSAAPPLISLRLEVNSPSSDRDGHSSAMKPGRGAASADDFLAYVLQRLTSLRCLPLIITYRPQREQSPGSCLACPDRPDTSAPRQTSWLTLGHLASADRRRRLSAAWPTPRRCGRCGFCCALDAEGLRCLLRPCAACSACDAGPQLQQL